MPARDAAQRRLAWNGSRVTIRAVAPALGSGRLEHRLARRRHSRRVDASLRATWVPPVVHSPRSRSTTSRAPRSPARNTARHRSLPAARSKLFRRRWSRLKHGCRFAQCDTEPCCHSCSRSRPRGSLRPETSMSIPPSLDAPTPPLLPSPPMPPRRGARPRRPCASHARAMSCISPRRRMAHSCVLPHLARPTNQSSIRPRVSQRSRRPSAPSESCW